MKKFLMMCLMVAGCVGTESSDSVNEPSLQPEVVDDYHPPGKIPVKRFLKCHQDSDCLEGFVCDQKQTCVPVAP